MLIKEIANKLQSLNDIVTLIFNQRIVHVFSINEKLHGSLPSKLSRQINKHKKLIHKRNNNKKTLKLIEVYVADNEKHNPRIQSIFF